MILYSGDEDCGNEITSAPGADDLDGRKELPCEECGAPEGKPCRPGCSLETDDDG